MHLGFDDEMLCAIARKSQMMGTLLVCTDCFEEEPTAAAAPVPWFCIASSGGGNELGSQQQVEKQNSSRECWDFEATASNGPSARGHPTKVGSRSFKGSLPVDGSFTCTDVAWRDTVTKTGKNSFSKANLAPTMTQDAESNNNKLQLTERA